MTITIVDTFGFFFRSYYALPPLTNSSGFPTGLLTGFVNFIDRLYSNHKTERIVFAIDTKGKTFRNEIYPEYKAHRPDAPEDLKTQLPVAIEWIEKMGFETIGISGFEADDMIATATRLSLEAGYNVRIITHDKDMYQLIDDGKVVIYDAVKNADIDSEACFEKFEVYPKDFINFQAILGDSADNVPGVKGVGQKGASKLINQYHTLEAIYADIENVTTTRNKNAMIKSEEMAYLSRELVTLNEHAFEALEFNRMEFPITNPILNISDELEEFEMHRVLKRITNKMSNNSAPVKKEISEVKKPTSTLQKLTFNTITLEDKETLLATIGAIPKESIVAFDTETTDIDIKSANLVGFSFSYDEENAYYVPLTHNYLGVSDQVSVEVAKEAISLLFEYKIVGQNLKFDLGVLKESIDFTPNNIYADTMIMAWLIDPFLRVGLDALSERYLKHPMISFKEMVKKGENFSHVEISKASEYAAEDAFITRKLYFILLEILKNQTPEILDTFNRVEIPFIHTLLDIESHGIMVDTECFEKLKEQSSIAIKTLEREIYDLCESEFNLNSPKQLGGVLFEQIGLPVIKKTKTGYSTDDTTLTKLLDAHPVIAKIQLYRERHKLHSTYIEPLLTLANNAPDNRIHTSFIQTGTATGRLSSKNPNLQNIPTRSELGKEIRGGFIAKEGYTLLGLDYSQIELRLLAHYSSDATLLDAFSNAKDIHRETAVKLFGEAEADEKRGVAKSVNFGLLYGMGSKKLADTVGISTKEAKSIIESYFEHFSSVKSYFEEIKLGAKKEGFVTTLLGRRRYFDFEKANGMQYAMFERESINTLFQGSAADLIKLSMNKIHEIYKNREDIKMLLQIHDELIFEVKEDMAEQFEKEIKDIMQNITPLKVPLVCNGAIAKSWKELK
jgi:DNA polymerase I